MLVFSLFNPYSLSLDSDGPFPVLGRLLTSRCMPIEDTNISSFANKTVLITGATSGCGFHCAKALSRVNCHLILTARNREKGEAASREIASMNPSSGATVDFLEMDMTSYTSIYTFRTKLQQYSQLDVAILNAGMYSTDFNLCPETELEETLQVNFLSTCLISLLLIPLLLKCSQQSRLLFISSEAHAWAAPRQTSFQDLQTQLNDPAAYACYERYHISKLLLVLWTQRLSSQIDPEKLLIASASPGFCRSGLFRLFNFHALAAFLEKLVCRTPDKGASQYILALGCMSKETHGAFYSDNKFRRPATATATYSAVSLRNSLWDDIQRLLPTWIQGVGQDIFAI
ncbi:hypothetical protein ANOM_004606 [Aspergillus nomiae NRRL 13137]|uniref:Short-chain dehydrogenase/reductase family protein n=1 Tax=Aspergillus nomiae NRRL (strain ATCC 15546 / NRRL 13137 / CBS 260.88 / M93) TaxID=1509407 RepID=A0A0L1J7P7_ASPN3|nr:uncharacterized protein ANOM_004606 [Aspergillus nomiae NRRL 13137]KNG87774.1 hypothetical protein ANOM_004606 [Aspergillus nomiae NRRL 13137]